MIRLHETPFYRSHLHASFKTACYFDLKANQAFQNSDVKFKPAGLIKFWDIMLQAQTCKVLIRRACITLFLCVRVCRLTGQSKDTRKLVVAISLSGSAVSFSLTAEYRKD